MAAGAGMVGAKVSTDTQIEILDLVIIWHDKGRFYFFCTNEYILGTQELQTYDIQGSENVPKTTGFQPRKKDEIG